MQTTHAVKKSKVKPKREIRIKRSSNPMDTSFLLIVLILLAFGLIMVFSASYANALAYRGDSLTYIADQSIFAVVGVIAMLIISKVNYRIYKKFAPAIFIIGFIMLILLPLPLPISEPLNNAQRWLRLGFVTFQPSEYMKFAIVVTFAALINANYDKMRTFRYGVLPFSIIMGGVAVLMMLQPHLSGTILLGCIGLSMMFVGGTRLRWFVLLFIMGILMVAAIVAVFGIDYIMDRINGWLDPFSDIQDGTFQTVQSLVAIGSGGIMGLGIGGSRQKYLFLPEPQNDFIFAIVVEELGLIGAILIILLFVLLVYRGFAIANKAPDKFASFLVIGIIVQIATQTLFNIGVVTNSIPNTGISLPFFSYGGTALMMQLAEMGVVLNVSRASSVEKL